MKKIKDMLKKGGIADIVTLIIIMGLVILLIVKFVLPWVNSTKTEGENVTSNVTEVYSSMGTMRQ